MVRATNLGFPYIGANRELKKLLESHWAGKLSENELVASAKQLQVSHWKQQSEQGIEFVPVGDYTFYDRVLDTAVSFNAIPARYQHIQNPLERYFAMARGLQKPATETSQKIDVPAMEMKKWFDTNYHFIVPEFEANQTFSLGESSTLRQFLDAKANDFQARPVVVGPVSFLFLGKPKGSQPFNTVDLLPKVLPCYIELFRQLKNAGAEWIQIDEPILVLDLEESVTAAFEKAYQTLNKESPLKTLIATYFGRIYTNINYIKDHVDGIHLDLVRNPEQLEAVLPLLKPQQVLSLGLVDGRNIWKNNLNKSIELAEKAVNTLGSDRVFIAPSCSLLHSPFSIVFETKIKAENPELYSWLSYSIEKCAEISTIAKALNEGRASVQAQLDENAKALESRRTSVQTTNVDVRKRVAGVTPRDFERASPFPKRREAQVKKLNLPLFPTTTIGSFPQTKEIRLARQKYFKGELTQAQYDQFIKDQIKLVVEFQEKIDLDVLVHGEPERNDMVEHFGHLLHGYAFTLNGWVVSYGSRGVKPPVIFGDVSRKRPMTIDESKYAQSITKKPMKGMLTGPTTMMKWSFVRDDIPLKDICTQIGLALRDEVVDLEAAGIPCIQVDEPAIREGLPLRRQDWNSYLEWSVPCFRLSTSGVRDETQIHTHMCYSDFNDIFDAIQALDADVITIENSRSDLKLLKIFETKQYTNEIGPGMYDIHSPRVPSVEEMKARFAVMLKYIPKHLLWINPDCGLKSRAWPETEAALKNMVEVAKFFRAEEDAK